MPRFAILYCKVAPAPYEGSIGTQYTKTCPVELFLVDGQKSTMKTNIGSENPAEVQYKKTQNVKEIGGTQRLMINNYVSDNLVYDHKALDSYANVTESPVIQTTMTGDKKKKSGILRSLGKRLRRLGRNIVGKQKKN